MVTGLDTRFSSANERFKFLGFLNLKKTSFFAVRSINSTPLREINGRGNEKRSKMSLNDGHGMRRGSKTPPID